MHASLSMFKIEGAANTLKSVENKSHLCSELNSKNQRAEGRVGVWGDVGVYSRLTSLCFVIDPIMLSKLRARKRSNIISVGKLLFGFLLFCFVFELLSRLLKGAFLH